MSMKTIEIILYAVCALVILLLVILGITFLNKNKNKGKLENNDNKEKVAGKNNVKQNTAKVADTKKDGKKVATAESGMSDVKNMTTDFVENFMEFDDIRDNMIIQNNGTKYVMVVKCQGINYDLMTEGEMIAVEEGFIQFLNTLRSPIQLYVQTTSVDLSESIKQYTDRVEGVQAELEEMQTNLKELEDEEDDSYKEQIDHLRYEIRKKKNIFEYGKDIIKTVSKISKNKSILKQNFYIVIPYFTSELGATTIKESDMRDFVFNELYTRSRGLLASLQVCSVTGKVLNSFELAELLYLSYNRDEGEIYTFKNAIDAQYDRLYHTAPDVLDKRIAQLDEEIVERAAEKANEAIIKARGWVPNGVDENNEMIQKLVYENQTQFILDYEGYIHEYLVDKAVENTKEEYKEKRKEMRENKNKKKDSQNNKEELVNDEVKIKTEEESNEVNNNENEEIVIETKQDKKQKKRPTTEEKKSTEEEE